MLVYGARLAAALVIRGWLRLYHRLKIVGRENLPVVPCSLQGAHRAFPKGCWLPRPRRVQLMIGEPRAYSHLPRDVASAHRISDELHDAVVALAPAPPPGKELAS